MLPTAAVSMHAGSSLRQALHLPRLQRRIDFVADVIIVEIAGELRRALLLEQFLETAPRGVPPIPLGATLREIEILDDPIEIFRVVADRLIGVFVLELVRFRLLAHDSYASFRTAYRIS